MNRRNDRPRRIIALQARADGLRNLVRPVAAASIAHATLPRAAAKMLRICSDSLRNAS